LKARTLQRATRLCIRIPTHMCQVMAVTREPLRNRGFLTVMFLRMRGDTDVDANHTDSIGYTDTPAK
jgi:hypothetical protein